MGLQIYCRYAPSLGELEGKTEKVWGTKEYSYKKNKNDPTVFFGLYDLRDYFSLWNHKGKKWVLWAGSDILNLKNNFLLNDGKLKKISKIFSGFPRMLDRWLAHNAEHWVENENEKEILATLGIKSKYCPSFMGKKEDYKISYHWAEIPNVYISASEGRQVEYGFDIIEKIAPKLPNVRFHLYGASWDTKQSNIKVHGRLPKEQMNREIMNMQCGLRLNEFDGFSEITAKSVLWGQYPITRIQNKLIPHYENEKELIGYLRSLTLMHQPNIIARDYYFKKLNDFPWVCK